MTSLTRAAVWAVRRATNASVTRTLYPGQNIAARAFATAAEPAPVDSENPISWRENLGVVRNNWTREEVSEIFHTPLLDLMYAAATVHRQNHDPRQVQQCTLLSIKTGGCPEDCGYCAQSSKHSKDVGLKAEKLLDLDYVYHEAIKAHENGSTRFCMGAAWRGPSQVGARPNGRRIQESGPF
eukprot:3122125-Pyramimonas_sp.AAC.1